MVKESVDRGRVIGNKSISIRIRRAIGPVLPQILEVTAAKALQGDMQAVMAAAALLQSAVALEK